MVLGSAHLPDVSPWNVRSSHAEGVCMQLRRKCREPEKPKKSLPKGNGKRLSEEVNTAQDQTGFWGAPPTAQTALADNNNNPMENPQRQEVTSGQASNHRLIFWLQHFPYEELGLLLSSKSLQQCKARVLHCPVFCL